MQSLIQQNLGNKFLITTDNWFFAPDGRQYRAVWGKVNVFSSDDTLGIKTNMRSTNWYVIVGEGNKQVVIAGCQVHYATMCNEQPNTENIEESKWSEPQGTMSRINRECFIYLAQ